MSHEHDREHEHGHDAPAEAVVVLITAPADKGDEIADAIVGGRLAACVNVVTGVRSVYRWEGQVRRDDEVLLVVKTAAAAVGPLTSAVRAIHPHENFELVAIRIDGGVRDYLEWIVRETRPS